MSSRTLEQFPSDFREVIVLRELEGLSYKEIARHAPGILGLSSHEYLSWQQLHRRLSSPTMGEPLHVCA
jgi:DNA-directed RNA polymerase specialized sigma24 family protein